MSSFYDTVQFANDRYVYMIYVSNAMVSQHPAIISMAVGNDFAV